MTRTVLTAAAVLLLAGCTTGPAEQTAPTPPPSSSAPTPTATPPPPPPPSPNEVYLAEIRHNAAGVYELEPDRKLIDRGRRVCAALDAGAGIPGVLRLAAAADYELGLAGILTDAAITAYCPEHVT